VAEAKVKVVAVVAAGEAVKAGNGSPNINPTNAPHKMRFSSVRGA